MEINLTFGSMWCPSLELVIFPCFIPKNCHKFEMFISCHFIETDLKAPDPVCVCVCVCVKPSTSLCGALKDFFGLCYNLIQ